MGSAARLRLRSRRRFLTTGELARLSNMSRRAVIKAIASGRLAATETVGGHYRVALAAAQRFLAERGLDPEMLEVSARCRLLVAGDKFVRDLLADALRRPGAELLSADNLFDAGVLCVEQRPGLVVLDAAVAGANPAAVCRSIRSLEYCRGAQLMILAGRDDENAPRYRAAGADLVLARPLSMHALKAAVAALDAAGPRRSGDS